MRLVTYEARGAPRLGALVKGWVVDLQRAAKKSSAGSLPSDMLSLIRGGDPSLAIARGAVKWAAARLAEGAAEGVARRADDTRLMAPLPNPPKLICLGLNYREHAVESGESLPPVPLLFSKFQSAIIGPGDAIKVPRVSEQVDFEAELTFVIGKGGKHIEDEAAMLHVLGYTCMNDVSCREYQYKTSQWLAGKTFDTFAPMGPVIVTTDEIPDPHRLDIKLSINDEVMQHSNTSDMLFSIATVIAYASKIFTLEPGDVFMTGSPPGVGEARTPPRWLRPGDVVRIEMEGVGTLINPVDQE